MKNISYYAALAALALFSACSSSAQKEDNNTDTTAVSSDSTLNESTNANGLDTTKLTFFKEGTLSRLAEIESSKKTLQKTTNPRVKALAEAIVKGQDSIFPSLKALADDKGYELPRVLPDDKLAEIREMDSYKNEGRDEFYVRSILKEHQRLIDLFSFASRSSDKQISSFAVQALPGLKSQYQIALKTDSALLVPKANQGDDPLKISDRKKN